MRTLGHYIRESMIVVVLVALPSSVGAERPPNFVVFFVDNLGYGNTEPFGSQLHKTPNLNRMAKEGRLFTHFYVSSGVCTPSRASLLTGVYPRRIGMHWTDGRVLRPVSHFGLSPEEITIAEILKESGYATGVIGKWHLGDQEAFLPTRQGFDYFFGIPYSDDMVHTSLTARERGWPPLPLMRNERVIEAPADRNSLTQRETQEAIEFIRRHHDEAFFLYIAHSMPGSTKAPFVSAKFRGESKNGAWGDSIEELDWAAGQVLDVLDELELSEHTLIIWTSDNGAPRFNPPKGRNTPLHGWGYTTAEGGQRVPCIMWWPGQVPAGTTCDELATTMDLLPTFAALAGSDIPDTRLIDGQNIQSLWTGRKGSKSPLVAFYYYDGPQLQAVRSGRWKLYLPLEAWRGQQPPNPDLVLNEPALYDVVLDPGESRDLAKEHPAIVRQLERLAALAREELGDDDEPGRNQRPAGYVKRPKPLLLDGTEPLSLCGGKCVGAGPR